MGCKHGDKAFDFTIADTLDFPAKYIFSVAFFKQFHSVKLKYQNTHSVEIGQQLIMLDFIFIEACFSNFNSFRWFSDFAVGQDMLQ